jgi:N-acetylglucosaminyldiphosphoundecaprenol N-acetyl-beta-D-mannosaminyltransferase
MDQQANVTNFLGVNVEALTYADMFARTDRWLENKEGRSHHIACINTYCVTLALRNQRLKHIYNRADIIGPDGMPFVRWIQLFRRVPCDRFYAPDVIAKFAERAEFKNYSFYLYGGSPEVVAKMKEYLEAKYNYLRVVGYYSPPFRELRPEEDEQIVDEINDLRPDILAVGLGTPKQDYWIDEHIHRIKGAVIVASGATFDFLGGRVKMAPRFIQRSGFEWLYRLLSKDFTRLWRRYTLFNAIFLWNFLLQNLRVRNFDVEETRRR